MECLSYCIANTLDLTQLDNYFKSNSSQYISSKTRDVVKISSLDESKHLLFVFKNGTFVSWGIKRHQIDHYIKIMLRFANKPVSFLVRDEFSYKLNGKISIEPHDFFDVDCISIDDDTDDLKLSLSYGFSQSVKLQYFEQTLESLIERYTPLIQCLSGKGKIPISRSQIRYIIGDILNAKSEMNLISNFLYHPKYFWQHPTLEQYFIMLERYLHIQRRANAINHRLDTLNEIFDMFNGYLENRHSHNLEIIIIVLIMIEVLLAALRLH